MNLAEETKANQAKILAVLRDPEMEKRHIRESLFGSIDVYPAEEEEIGTTEDTAFNPKTCGACALGFCALAIGFDQFDWSEPSTRTLSDGRVVSIPGFWSWSDGDALEYVQVNADMSRTMIDTVIGMNDEQQESLGSIAAWLDAVWSGEQDEREPSVTEDDDDYHFVDVEV